MSEPKQYLCKNKEGNCPKYVKSTVITVGGSEPFVCPLKLANCQKDYLEPVSLPPPAWKKWAMVGVPIATVVAAIYFIIGPGSPGCKPPHKDYTNDFVIITDGGPLLNALLVSTPTFLGDAARKFKQPLAIGLWACRPLEPDGKRRTSLRNYTPTLLAADEFRKLNIPAAPAGNDLPPELQATEKLSYDLFSGLATVINEMRWTSPSNRHLVVLTGSSAIPKGDNANGLRLGAEDVRQLAAQKNVKLYAIHVIIPEASLRLDQDLTQNQLEALCAVSAGSGGLFTIRSSLTGLDGRRASAYEGELKSVFSKLLESVVPAPAGKLHK